MPGIMTYAASVCANAAWRLLMASPMRPLSASTGPVPSASIGAATRWTPAGVASQTLHIALMVARHVGLCVGLLCCSPPALAQFSYVTSGDGRPLIVFLHGLGGGAVTSFKAKGGDMTWPELMRDDIDRVRGARPLRDYATATLSFPATCSDRVTIPQVAASLVRTLYDDGIWMRHPSIIFIGYSLGGLVIQEMLTTSQNDPRYGALVDRTAGVIFLATPVGGSDHVDALATLLEHVPGFDRTCPLVKDLRSIDSNALLQKLDSDWRKFIQSEERINGRGRRLHCACLYETKSVFGVMIVGQSASATICDDRLAMNEDHLSIAKPVSRSSEVYKRAQGLIADIDLLKPARQRAPPPNSAPKRLEPPPNGLGLRNNIKKRAPELNLPADIRSSAPRSIDDQFKASPPRSDGVFGTLQGHAP